MFKFFRSVGQEMKKVTWLTTKRNRRGTTTVTMTLVLSALFLGALD